MAKEREDSFADDPLEEINLDNDDLDDLLGDAGKEDSDTKSSDEADDDLLSSDDLLEDDDLLSADDLEPETSDSESDPDNSAEISKEELDSLLAEADAPAEEDGEDEAPPEIDLEEFEEVLSEDDSDDSDATDILGDDDSAEEYPEVPDTLPQELMSELEEDSPDAEGSEEDDGGDTDALADDSESEEEKKTKGFKPKGKGKKGKKGFAAKGKADKGKKEPKKAAADRKKPVAAKSGGKTIDIICSECYSVLSLSATWEEDLVTCPECFHVGKKPDDSFLRTVSTAKARESKKAKMLALLSVLVIVSFTGFMFLKSAYGDANSLTAAEQAPLQAEVNSATTDLTNAKTRNLSKDKKKVDLEPLEDKVEAATSTLAGFLGHPDETEGQELTATANGIVVVTDEGTVDEETKHHFLPDVPKEEHKDTVDLWAQICLYGGGLFLLLLIWQACRYEGNRWEAYF